MARGRLAGQNAGHPAIWQPWLNRGVQGWVVIQTLADFDESTAFERFALSRGVPLFDYFADPRTIVDLREGSRGVNIFVSDFLGGDPATGLRDVALRPLFFGSAWKITDLFVELTLFGAGLQPSNGMRWLINEKTKHAANGSGHFALVTADKDLWNRLCRSYCATEEVRHSLVHRRASVANGDLVGTSRSGNPLPPVSGAEQSAFCQATQRVAAWALTGGISVRDHSDLLWQLDQLAALHGMPEIGGQAASPVVRVVAEPIADGDGWVVDPSKILSEAKASVGGRIYFDLELHVPGDFRRWEGRLDANSHGPTKFDPSAPPPWLVEMALTDGA